MIHYTLYHKNRTLNEWVVKRQYSAPLGDHYNQQSYPNSKKIMKNLLNKYLSHPSEDDTPADN